MAFISRMSSLKDLKWNNCEINNLNEGLQVEPFISKRAFSGTFRKRTLLLVYEGLSLECAASCYCELLTKYVMPYDFKYNRKLVPPTAYNSL